MDFKAKENFSKPFLKEVDTVSEQLCKQTDLDLKESSSEKSYGSDNNNFPTAAFSARFFAALIDHGILLTVMVVPIVLSILVSIFLIKSRLNLPYMEYVIAVLGLINLVLQIALPFVPITYYAWFESSKFQATPGKMKMGLKVVDTKTLNKVGVKRAIWKSFVQYFLFIVIMIVSAIVVKLVCSPPDTYKLFGWYYNVSHGLLLLIEAGIAGVLFCLPVFANKRFTILDKLTRRTVVDAKRVEL